MEKVFAKKLGFCSIQKIQVNAMCDLFLKPLSKPLPEAERGFESYSPSLVGKGLGVRFEIKLHTA
jgi:hypothetical protein